MEKPCKPSVLRVKYNFLNNFYKYKLVKYILYTNPVKYLGLANDIDMRFWNVQCKLIFIIIKVMNFEEKNKITLFFTIKKPFALPVSFKLFHQNLLNAILLSYYTSHHVFFTK